MLNAKRFELEVCVCVGKTCSENRNVLEESEMKRSAESEVQCKYITQAITNRNMVDHNKKKEASMNFLYLSHKFFVLDP